LGKSANRWFDSAAQHFFSARDNFSPRARAALLSRHGIGAEHERILKFVKKIGARDEGEASFSRRCKRLIKSGV
jgi:hypothetical protein